MTDKNGKSSTGRLALRVRKRTLAEIGHDVVEGAQSAEQGVSSSSTAQVTHATDFIDSATDDISNQNDLVTSFISLLDKVGFLLRIGNEIAKVWSFSCYFLFTSFK